MKVKILLSFFIVVAFTLFSSAAYATHPDCEIGDPGIEDLEDQIECAIEKGLEYISGVQGGDGSWWSNHEYISTTGLMCVKYIDRAKELELDPFDTSEYDYADELILAINYIASHIIAGDAGELRSDNYAYRTYTTGVADMCFSAAAIVKPDGTVTTGDGVKTYTQIVQGLNNWLTGNQQTTGCQEGGWNYQEKEDRGGNWADNSISGYATMGLGFAQSFAGVSTPAANLSHLDAFIDTVQQFGGPWDGGSKYGGWWSGTPPDCSSSHGPYINTLKTGNLLYELCLVGEGEGDDRVDRALNYLETYWDASSGTVNGSGWKNDPQAMFTMMKGLEGCGVDNLDLDGGGSRDDDWFAEVAQWIVDSQYWNGSFHSGYSYGNVYLDTAWSLLTLERAVPELIGHVPFDIKPGSCPNPINVKSKGVLPAAIMGTDDLDVTTIDPASLRLRLKGTEDEGVAPLRWALADVGEPFEPYIGKEDCYEDCVDCSCADGKMDIVFNFDTQEAVETLGLSDFGDEACEVLEIIGFLKEEYNGTPIVGEDVVRILVKGKQK